MCEKGWEGNLQNDNPWGLRPAPAGVRALQGRDSTCGSCSSRTTLGRLSPPHPMHSGGLQRWERESRSSRSTAAAP